MKLQITIVDDNEKILGTAEMGLNGNQNVPEQPEEKMTDAQRRYLFRLLSEMGIEGVENAKRAILESLQVKDIKEITKSQASSLIEKWKGKIDSARKQEKEG